MHKDKHYSHPHRARIVVEEMGVTLSTACDHGRGMHNKDPGLSQVREGSLGMRMFESRSKGVS